MHLLCIDLSKKLKVLCWGQTPARENCEETGQKQQNDDQGKAQKAINSVSLIGALLAFIQCWQGRNRNNGNQGYQGTTIVQKSDNCSFTDIIKFGLVVFILVGVIGFLSSFIPKSETTTDSPTINDSTTIISSTTQNPITPEAISTTDETESGPEPEPEPEPEEP